MGLNHSGTRILQTPWPKSRGVVFTAPNDVIELLTFMIRMRMDIFKAVAMASHHTTGTEHHPIQLLDNDVMELTDSRHRSLALLFHRIITFVVRMFAFRRFQSGQRSARAPLGSMEHPRELPTHQLGTAFPQLLSNYKRMSDGEVDAIEHGIPTTPHTTTRHHQLSSRNVCHCEPPPPQVRSSLLIVCSIMLFKLIPTRVL